MSKKDKNPKQEKIISPQRKRLLFITTLAIPFLLFALLESGLRLFNYGQDLSLFNKEKINGIIYHVLNPWIKARYFPNYSIAPEAAADYFLVPKPKGTLRIFCLGGSTVVGYPYYYNASFANFLRYRLTKIFPDKSIEVINLGMTAVNSFTTLDISNELAKYEPDLLLVYDGHNEFYGGLSVTSNVAISGSRWVTLLYLKLIHSRVYQLVQNTVNGIRNYFTNRTGQKIDQITLEFLAKNQFIPYQSQLYNVTEKSFDANMEDLSSICRENKIPIILATQVSNLRDIPPFVSIESEGLSQADKESFQRHLNNGITAWDAEKIDTALVEFRSASAIDTLYASVRFAIAHCLNLLGNTKEARSEYFKAKDYDQLRFRTSSEFNQLIKKMADNTTVGVADMEKIFLNQSPDSLIGNNIIIDHVHPNSYGYFLMAKGYANIMRQRGILASIEEWARCDTVNDQTLWDERPISELDELIAERRNEYQLLGWPFSKERKSVSAISPDDTLRQLANDAALQNIGWGNAHFSAAFYYQQKQDWKNLERELKVMIELVPLDVNAYLNLAKYYIDRSRYEEAKKILEKSTKIKSTALVQRFYGDIALLTGKLKEAIKYYESLKSYSQTQKEQADNNYQLALAYYKNNQLNKAESEIEKILSIRANDASAIALQIKIKRKQLQNGEKL